MVIFSFQGKVFTSVIVKTLLSSTFSSKCREFTNGLFFYVFPIPKYLIDLKVFPSFLSFSFFLSVFLSFCFSVFLPFLFFSFLPSLFLSFFLSSFFFPSAFLFIFFFSSGGGGGWGWQNNNKKFLALFCRPGCFIVTCTWTFVGHALPHILWVFFLAIGGRGAPHKRPQVAIVREVWKVSTTLRLQMTKSTLECS